MIFYFLVKILKLVQTMFTMKTKVFFNGYVVCAWWWFVVLLVLLFVLYWCDLFVFFCKCLKLYVFFYFFKISIIFSLSLFFVLGTNKDVNLADLPILLINNEKWWYNNKFYEYNESLYHKIYWKSTTKESKITFKSYQPLRMIKE